MASKFKKGDRVMVIAGEQRPRKGQDGKKKPVVGQILKVLPDEDRVIISGVNMVKRHTKARPPDDPGGIIEKPASMHLSNVMPIDPSDKKPCRVRIEEKDGKRIRVSARTGKALD